MSKGDNAGTVFNVKLLLQDTIKVNAAAIILCPKHPGGNLQPSESDDAITNKVKESVQVIVILLPDHLIIIPEGSYYSLADEGLI